MTNYIFLGKTRGGFVPKASFLCLFLCFHYFIPSFHLHLNHAVRIMHIPRHTYHSTRTVQSSGSHRISLFSPRRVYLSSFVPITQAVTWNNGTPLFREKRAQWGEIMSTATESRYLSISPSFFTHFLPTPHPTALHPPYPYHLHYVIIELVLASSFMPVCSQFDLT